ncbi:hypothetical protein ACKWTF_001054 [Chironomus riparius]
MIFLKHKLVLINSVVYCLFKMRVLILSFLMLFGFTNCDDSIPCRFSDGSFGKCVDIKNCESLYGLFRQGTIRIKDLPICDQIRRLVCCPRISAKKCKEYGKSAVETKSDLNILPTTKCNFSPSPLLIGRHEASPLEFPHQALIGYQINDEFKWICGGSLISSEFVLTATQCIDLIEYGAIKFVKLGVLDRLNDGAKSLFLLVKQTFKHSKGKWSSLHNDIALLKLQWSINFDENILPACLPTRPYYDTKAIETGFGENGIDYDTSSQKLLKDEVRKFNQQICKDLYDEKFNESTMLCYGHNADRKDFCITEKGKTYKI